MEWVMTPFMGALPASSPVLFLKNDLFLSITSCPEILTVLEPSEQSLAMPVFGYGIGTPGGVAGVWGGVMQTSGMAQIVFPSACLQDTSIVLAYTWLLIAATRIATLLQRVVRNRTRRDTVLAARAHYPSCTPPRRP